ncbi:MAG: hypothetical protein LBB34_00025 [Holosporales bacterium]|jgi:hypothetical protein|nr:hypothetical protein [Holosporales bacterium]
MVMNGNGSPLTRPRPMTVYTHRIDRATNENAPYVIAGNKIWANIENVILEYVKNVDNINAFTPLFMNCITYDLAMRGAKVLIDSASYVEQMRAALTQEITFAMGLDEGQQVAPRTTSFSRYGVHDVTPLSQNT